jgi:hypothetical protein
MTTATAAAALAATILDLDLGKYKAVARAYAGDPAAPAAVISSGD